LQQGNDGWLDPDADGGAPAAPEVAAAHPGVADPEPAEQLVDRAPPPKIDSVSLAASLSDSISMRRRSEPKEPGAGLPTRPRSA
jgi:hypothetical protein